MADTFAVDVQKWVNLKAKGNVDKVVRATFIQLATSIIERSPVKIGRFRNNWFTSIGAMSRKTTTRPGKTGAARIADARKISQNAYGNVIWLTNNLPYARPLEYGHSRIQAPQGMVRVTVAEFNRIVAAEARKVNK